MDLSSQLLQVWEGDVVRSVVMTKFSEQIAVSPPPLYLIGTDTSEENDVLSRAVPFKV